MSEAISPGAHTVTLREFESEVRHLTERQELETRRIIGIVNSEIKHLRTRTDEAAKAAETALVKALQSLEKRLDELNQFKAAFKDQTTLYATKEKLDSEIDAVKERLNKLENRNTGQLGWIAGAIAVASLVILFARWYFEAGRGG